LILFLISNVERRSKNEEVGERTKYEVLSTKYGEVSWSLGYLVQSNLASCLLHLVSESTW
jgi:hypothetical protein